MNSYIKHLKSQLKVLAQDIRSKKSKRKELKGYVPELLEVQHAYRHMHIAYCLLRGKTYEQIEKPHKNNQPNQVYIQYWMAPDPKLTLSGGFPRWYHKAAEAVLNKVEDEGKENAG